MQDNNARGVADPAHVQRQQKKRDDYEKALEQTYPSEREGGLRNISCN
ncbi:hypothetical protein RvY_08851 [Ramazzottius varieornatus]|uniref:Uncharacterized protein n=1 Tax=Ramazzottius varieornatus TaxID=947166 RepID=A0A1D1VCW1_RAMVA|nr:hypothetical protein RvY_08851 [Ramazzottius varieornatus]